MSFISPRLSSLRWVVSNLHVEPARVQRGATVENSLVALRLSKKK